MELLAPKCAKLATLLSSSLPQSRQPKTGMSAPNTEKGETPYRFCHTVRNGQEEEEREILECT
jgi:hypothetical protein